MPQDRENVLIQFEPFVEVSNLSTVTLDFDLITGGLVLVSPTDLAMGVSINGPVTWSPLAGWGYYQLQIATDSGFVTIVDTVITQATSRDVSLVNETTYYWRVRPAKVAIPGTEIAVTSVTVSPNPASVEPNGGTVQLTANVQVTGGASQEVEWESDTPAVATVGLTTGLVTSQGVLGETATITATSTFDGTKSGSTVVTIAEQDAIIDTRAGDEAALTDFRDSTTYSGWFVKTGWPATGTVSLATPMTGVTVETINGELRVVELDMQKQTYDQFNSTAGNNLTGTLPASIGNLRMCRKLNLKQNHFTGTIPDSIGNMVSLQRLSLGGQACELDLDNLNEWYESSHVRCPGGTFTSKRFEQKNEFTGPIPTTIGNLVNLELLEIRRQYLTGTLPAEIGQLTNLRALFVDNQLGPSSTCLGGPLPGGWGGLVNLRRLGLTMSDSSGSYSGHVPLDWQNWSNINYVMLSGNSLLVGPPPIFPNATNVRYVQMKHCKFKGDFPSDYFDGKNGFMTKFDMAYMYLGGTVPQEFSPVLLPTPKDGHDSLSHFGLGWNNLTGNLPGWVKKLRRVQIFELNVNNFTSGMDDDFFEGWIHLRNINMAGSNFNTTLPSSFGNSRSNSSTQRLEFRSAGFIGAIPESWVNYRTNGTLFLYLDNNQLSGLVPVGLADWRSNTTWSVPQASIDTTNNVINVSNTFVDGNILYFESTVSNPGGLATNTKYYVINRTTTSYQVSTVAGGSAVNISNTGSGTITVRRNAWRTGQPGCRINNNNFTYSDIIPLINAWRSDITLTYGPTQKAFPVDEYLSDIQNPAAGSTLTLNLSGIDVAGNVYQWRKNGQPLSNGGRVSGATSHTLVITTAEAGDGGEYTLRITNPNAPQLTESISEPINVQVSA